MAKNNSAVPLLALILAIPALACYVWWTHLNTETKRQLSLRVRSRTDGVKFGAVSDRDRLNNPIAPAAAPAVLAGSSSTAAPPAPLPAAASPAPAAPAASPDAVAAAAPVLIARDPMLSPFDLVRLQQIEYEKEQARLELERAQSISKNRSEASVESRIELEGIVSGQRGNRAIINGERVEAGDVVLGAKIVRITSQSVVFVYRTRRFIKSISK